MQAKLLTCAFVGAFSLFSSALYGATVLSTSVFGLPTSEYTHIIIETNQATSHSMMILKNPNRVVLDLKNTPINESLILLTKKDFLEDLSIKQVRVGNFKAGITRIVFDLKTEVKAVLNIDKPKDKYQHRLMLDIYPLQINHKTMNQIDKGTYAIKDDSGNDSSKSSNPTAKHSKTTDFKTTDSKVTESKTIEPRSSSARIILEPPPYDEILVDEDY